MITPSLLHSSEVEDICLRSLRLPTCMQSHNMHPLKHQAERTRILPASVQTEGARLLGIFLLLLHAFPISQHRTPAT